MTHNKQNQSLMIDSDKKKKYHQLKHLNSQHYRALRLMHQGLNNVEIAEAMDRSTKTIESYTSYIYDILGQDNRVKAVLFYERFLVDYMKYGNTIGFEPLSWL